MTDVYFQNLVKWTEFPVNRQRDASLVSPRAVVFVQVRLPDVEFFVNLGDWPLEKRRPTEKLHPIFSWCGSNDTRDIVMPTYDLTESVLETMGRQGSAPPAVLVMKLNKIK